VRVWDIATGKELRRLDHPDNPSSDSPYQTVVHTALSGDGKVLACSAGQGVIQLWEPASGRQRGPTLGAPTTVVALALSSDGKQLAWCGHDGSLRLWETSSGREVHAFDKADRQAQERYYGLNAGLAFSPDGRVLASSSLEVDDDKLQAVVRLWDVTGGTLHARLAPAGDRVEASCPVFSPDGRWLAWGAAPGTVLLTDVATGEELRRFEDGPTRLGGLVFGPDGRTLYAKRRGESSIVAWDVDSGELVRNLGRPGQRSGDLRRVAPGSLHELSVSPDGSLLACANGENFLELVDRKGKVLRTPGEEGHIGGLFNLHYTSDGKSLVSQGGGAIWVWDPVTGRATERVGVPVGTRLFLLSPDGRTLVTEGRDGTVRLWDAGTGQERHRLVTRTGLATFAFSPDGKRLAVRGRAMPGALLFDVKSGKKVRTLGSLDPAEAPLESRLFARMSSMLVFSPDGRRLAAPEGPKGVLVWDVTTGRETRINLPVARPVRDGAFTRDGRGLVLDTEEGGLSLWEVVTGQRRQAYGIPAREPWDPLAPGRRLPDFALSLHSSGPVAVSADSRMLALGADDGMVRVWDLFSGEELKDLQGHRGEVTSLVFAPNGRELATGGADTTALVWPLPAPKRSAPPKPKPAELEILWDDLKGDASRGFRAIGALRSSPRETVTLLRRRLRPAEPVEARRLERLIADLDDERFAVRRDAFEALELLGQRAVPALRKALQGPPSLELRKRVEELLHLLAVRGVSRAEVRLLRALEALEGIATPEARALLEVLAKGDPEAVATVESRAALERLGQNSGR
ncbi:MAG TPA: PQQ-binding-like beta-propeller repeat protein, partial [Gemmataceae bacterium]|nr:PQQ-binding-like beta-propeller repeat protein [Gemmataceae bacterium]